MDPRVAVAVPKRMAKLVSHPERSLFLASALLPDDRHWGCFDDEGSVWLVS